MRCVLRRRSGVDIELVSLRGIVALVVPEFAVPLGVLRQLGRRIVDFLLQIIAGMEGRIAHHEGVTRHVFLGLVAVILVGGHGVIAALA